MMVNERLGIDLGVVSTAERYGAPAAELGARIVRVRFPLHRLSSPDEAYFSQAESGALALASAGLRILAVVDGSLTVAPEGMGTFAESPPEALAAAWTAELRANTQELARTIGEHVAAWEVLPEPNVGNPPRIAPVRWAALLAEVADTLRYVDSEAVVVSGGLSSDEFDDASDYLRRTYRAAERSGIWSATAPPFSKVGLRFRVLPDGGPSEDTVAAALSERTRRIRRVVEECEGADAAGDRGVLITGISWDADRVGEAVQARNVWTAFNTLTADPAVEAVVWSSLVDSPTASYGLYRTDEMEEGDRRPSWKAYSDFADYARNISPAPGIEAVVGSAALSTTDAAETVAPGQSIPQGTPGGAAGALTAGETPEPAPEIAPETAPETISFHLPDVREVLSAQGLTDSRLDRVIEAVEAKYGGQDQLPPGEYQVELPRSADQESRPKYTNQQLVTALYVAGGATWDLFERTGLVLAEMTARRSETYTGPSLDSLGLDPDELEAVLGALERSD